MTNLPPEPALLPEPDVGRRFTRRRIVRLSDVDVDGYLRLDATARYGQDVANDDSIDGGLSEAAAMGWVVRKTTIERHRPATLREELTMVTWCSGVGSRWAERRTTLRGDRGARVELATVWVHVDPDSGAPRKLPPEFDELYSESAQGRKIRARLSHDQDAPPSAVEHQWPLRRADFDVLDHVNNAAAWAIAEEFGHRRLAAGQPTRAEIEYRDAIPAGSDPAVFVDETGDGLSIWVRVEDKLCTTITLADL